MNKIRNILILMGLSFFSIAFTQIQASPTVNLDPTTINAARFSKHIEESTEAIAAQKEKATESKIEIAESEGKPAKEELKPTEKVKAPRVTFLLNNIYFEGNNIYSATTLSQYYKQYLHQQVSIDDLQKIVNSITANYRKNGYILSLAVLPAQNIKDGNVKILIIEGFISDVKVTGEISAGLKAKLLKYAEKIKAMRPLEVKALERYILLMNEFPGIKVKSILTPSLTVPYASELTLATEIKKVQITASFDNRGIPSIGPNEIIAGIEINDFLHLADQIIVQTALTPADDELRFAQILYKIPIKATPFTFSLGANVSDINPGGYLADLDLIGKSINWSATLDYLLFKTRGYSLSLFGKFDWLDSKTDFDKQPLMNDHVRSIRIGANYNSVDKKRGVNNINLTLSQGIKAFGASPENPITPLSRKNGKSNYTKISGEIARLQDLKNSFSVLTSLSGQYAFHTSLLSSEEIGFGGVSYGRGYDSSEIMGDSGVLGKLELRYFSQQNLRLLQYIQYYALIDAGLLWNSCSADSQEARPSAISSGIGARFSILRNILGNLELDRPLTRRVQSQVDTHKNPRGFHLYFGININI